MHSKIQLQAVLYDINLPCLYFVQKLFWPQAQLSSSYFDLQPFWPDAQLSHAILAGNILSDAIKSYNPFWALQTPLHPFKLFLTPFDHYLSPLDPYLTPLCPS